MSKSPFRPSDDASSLPFPIAANAMAVVNLRNLSSLLTALNETEMLSEALELSNEILKGIQMFGIRDHPKYGSIYAYEVDGFGSSYFMDDAGIPSLLSLPYLGFCNVDDAIYQNTREFILSPSNPYYSVGTAGKGVGSPHIGLGYIWPMSIIMRALTSNDDNEILDCLKLLKNSSANTGFIHESFWKDSVYQYTRPWFAWVNSLFGQLILNLAQNKPLLLFDAK